VEVKKIRTYYAHVEPKSDFNRLSSALVITSLVAACGGGGKASSNSAGERPATPTGPVEVTTVAAIDREVSVFIEATGDLEADEQSEIAPQTSGQVAATPVDVGAFVKDFEEATNRLRDQVDDNNRAEARDAEEVLSRGRVIDGFMRRHRLESRAENDWSRLRGELNTLARLYRIKARWR